MLFIERDKFAKKLGIEHVFWSCFFVCKEGKSSTINSHKLLLVTWLEHIQRMVFCLFAGHTFGRSLTLSNADAYAV